MKNKRDSNGIYKITNLVSDKKYYGSSINILTRWNDHKKELRGNYHYNKHLQSSWNKHGKDNFLFKIILLCEEFELLRYEQWFLDNVVRWGTDYNICETAGNTLGYIHTKETKRKMSKVAMGKYAGESNPLYGVRKYGKENSFYGRKHTEESKRKMSIANKGKHHTEEAKRKMSEAHKGKIVSEETRKKMWESRSSSKLKVLEVLIIRELLSTKKYTQTTLGKMFDVSHVTIGHIDSRKTWRYI